jgi:hypothetical protein
MYNTREALAYSGKLPVQQNPAGVTPQLLDLLAMQKVEADKKAAAQTLAMSAGQANMPTVAQGIEQQALNSARGEIAQKLGLAGLAQQQPPQGPAPQMPPQQGLEGAPSPLPESYQEGGIVAFAGTTDGSKVPYAEEERKSDREALTNELSKFGYAAADIAVMPIRAVTALYNNLVLRPARALGAETGYLPMVGGGDYGTEEYRSVTPYSDRAYVEAQGEKPVAKPASTSTATMPTDATRRGDIRFPPSGSLTPVSIPAYRREKAVGLADAVKANLSAVNPPATPAVNAPAAYDPNSFTGMAMKAQTDAAALKPEDAYAKGKEEYQTEIGAGLAKDRESQQARIAGIQALYDRQAGERPSNFIRGLQLMGKNTRGFGLGGAFEGVSEGIDKSAAGYTTQDIANQTAIDGLNAAMEKARQSDDIGRYTAAKSARDAILTQKKEATKDLSQLAGYEQQAQTAALRLSSEEKRAIAQNLNAKEIAYIQAASANRPGETERLLKKYNDLKITDPAAAENMMKDLERIKTGSKPETAQQTLELKRQALMAKDESYKMAAIAYYNAKDPAKKQKAKDTMDAIEKAYGITGESTPDAGIGAPPPGAVKKIG